MIAFVPCCYHDLEITEPKHSVPVTYPETDEEAQISFVNRQDLW